ncbi:putative DnaJ domain containing protein [Blattamonas nauphoetae]|uniref:DnaJ domain containing protein n=1 Tax=Blattamonas nauphoetae TaxID=2049346 RepID=A0ABQ9XQE4_9EUKA|nr:putative DnaJ domain containing protein [Blattamonas nauphoetae]
MLLKAFLILTLLPSFNCAKKDLYKILGVRRDASHQEIKKRYRELSMKLHPDKNRDDPNATDKYAEITNAYEILGNPDTRRQYDITGDDQNVQSGKFQGGGGGGNPFGGFPFGFGGGGQQFTFSFGGFDFGGFSGFPGAGGGAGGGQKCVKKKTCDARGDPGVLLLSMTLHRFQEVVSLVKRIEKLNQPDIGDVYQEKVAESIVFHKQRLLLQIEELCFQVYKKLMAAKPTSQEVVVTTIETNRKQLLSLLAPFGSWEAKYSNLVFLLRSYPQILIRIGRDSPHEELDNMVQSLILPLFAPRVSPIERELFLRLISNAVLDEMNSSRDPRYFLRANTFASKLLTAYSKSSECLSYLHSVVGPFVNSVLADKSLDLEVDPVNLARTLRITNSCGPDDAICRKEISSLVSIHQADLEHCVAVLLNRIDSRMSEIPFTLRQICAIMLQSPTCSGMTIRDKHSLLSPPSVAAAVNLRSRRNLTLIAKVLQTTVNLDTFETKESYLQMMAYPFIFSARKLMLNKFCTDFVDVSTKFEYIEASPKLSDLPTFHNPSYSSFGVVSPGIHLPITTSTLISLHGLVIAQQGSLPLHSPAHHIVSTLGSKIPSEHEFHAKSTQMFIEYRPAMERLKSPSLHPLFLPLLQVRHPLHDFILSVGDTREDTDHGLDQTESALPPSLQLDDELKEEPTLLSGIRVPVSIPIPTKKSTTHSPDSAPVSPLTRIHQSSSLSSFQSTAAASSLSPHSVNPILRIPTINPILSSLKTVRQVQANPQTYVEWEQLLNRKSPFSSLPFPLSHTQISFMENVLCPILVVGQQCACSVRGKNVNHTFSLPSASFTSISPFSVSLPTPLDRPNNHCQFGQWRSDSLTAAFRGHPQSFSRSPRLPTYHSSSSLISPPVNNQLMGQQWTQTMSVGEVIDEGNEETQTNSVFSTPRSVPTTRSARSQPVSPVSPEQSIFIFDSEERRVLSAASNRRAVAASTHSFNSAFHEDFRFVSHPLPPPLPPLSLFPLPSATNLLFPILPLNDEMLVSGGSSGMRRKGERRRTGLEGKKESTELRLGNLSLYTPRPLAFTRKWCEKKVKRVVKMGVERGRVVEGMIGMLGVLEEEVMRGRRDDDENDSLDEYQTAEQTEFQENTPILNFSNPTDTFVELTNEEQEEGRAVRERMAETRIETAERARQQLEAQIELEEERKRREENEWDITGEEEEEAGGLAKRAKLESTRTRLIVETPSSNVVREMGENMKGSSFEREFVMGERRKRIRASLCGVVEQERKKREKYDSAKSRVEWMKNRIEEELTMSNLVVASAAEGWAVTDDVGDTVSLKRRASSFASLSSVGSVLEKDQKIVAAFEGERRIVLPPGEMGEEEEREWAKREEMRHRGTFLLSHDSFTVATEDDDVEIAEPNNDFDSMNTIPVTPKENMKTDDDQFGEFDQPEAFSSPLLALLSQARRVQLTHTPQSLLDSPQSTTLTKQMDRTGDSAMWGDDERGRNEKRRAILERGELALRDLPCWMLIEKGWTQTDQTPLLNHSPFIALLHSTLSEQFAHLSLLSSSVSSLALRSLQTRSAIASQTAAAVSARIGFESIPSQMRKLVVVAKKEDAKNLKKAGDILGDSVVSVGRQALAGSGMDENTMKLIGPLVWTMREMGKMLSEGKEREREAENTNHLSFLVPTLTRTHHSADSVPPLSLSPFQSHNTRRGVSPTGTGAGAGGGVGVGGVLDVSGVEKKKNSLRGLFFTRNRKEKDETVFSSLFPITSSPFLHPLVPHPTLTSSRSAAPAAPSAPTPTAPAVLPNDSTKLVVFSPASDIVVISVWNPSLGEADCRLSFVSILFATDGNTIFLEFGGMSKTCLTADTACHSLDQAVKHADWTNVTRIEIHGNAELIGEVICSARQSIDKDLKFEIHLKKHFFIASEISEGLTGLGTIRIKGTNSATMHLVFSSEIGYFPISTTRTPDGTKRDYVILVEEHGILEVLATLDFHPLQLPATTPFTKLTPKFKTEVWDQKSAAIIVQKGALIMDSGSVGVNDPELGVLILKDIDTMKSIIRINLYCTTSVNSLVPKGIACSIPENATNTFNITVVDSGVKIKNSSGDLVGIDQYPLDIHLSGKCAAFDYDDTDHKFPLNKTDFSNITQSAFVFPDVELSRSNLKMPMSLYPPSNDLGNYLLAAFYSDVHMLSVAALHRLKVSIAPRYHTEDTDDELIRSRRDDCCSKVGRCCVISEHDMNDTPIVPLIDFVVATLTVASSPSIATSTDLIVMVAVSATCGTNVLSAVVSG